MLRRATIAVCILVWAASSVPCRASGMSAPERKRASAQLDAAALFLKPDATAEQWLEEFGDLDAPLFGEDEEVGGILRDQSMVERRIGSLLTVEIGATTLLFRDVPRDAWYAPYVRAAAERGILQGYRDAGDAHAAEYRGERPVSVEEVAKVALAARGVEIPCSTKPARNASASGSWSLPYIACAEARGWALFADGSADVRRPATRAEVVLTVLQAFSVQGPSLQGDSVTFRDVPPSLLSAQAISRAAQDGIVGGYARADGTPTGYFGPDDPVSRAQLAKIVMLSIERYGR